MDDSDFTIPKKLTNATTSVKSSTTVPVLRVDRLKRPSMDPSLRGAHTQCPVCSKDLNHLSDVRRAIHVNACIDSEKNKAAVSEALNMSKTMFACPCCGDMIAKGPYLIAHATKCAKMFDLDVSAMIKTLETHSTIDAKLRAQGLSKAAPLTSELIKKAKKRLLESESTVSDTYSAQPPPKISKTNRSRGVLASKLKSTVFVSKEPVTCRCNGLHVIQNRFCAQFRRIKSSKKTSETSMGLEEAQVCKNLKKLDRLTRLADDLRRNLFKVCDIKLRSKEGITVPANTFIISARTKLTIPKDSKEIPLPEYSLKVLEAYVQYLYTAEITWTLDEHEEIGKLARAFGPLDLAMLIDNEDDKFEIDMNNYYSADDNIEEMHAFEELPLSNAAETEIETHLQPTTNINLTSTAPVVPLMKQSPEPKHRTVSSSDDDIAVIDYIPAPQKKSLSMSQSRNENPSPLLKTVSESNLPHPHNVSTFKSGESVLSKRSESTESFNVSLDLFESSPSTSFRQCLTTVTPPEALAKDTSLTIESHVVTSISAVAVAQRSVAVLPEDDSFYDDAVFKPNTPQHRILPSSPDKPEMTETGKARYIAMKLGSGVKVLKTSNITPMPTFETFTDAELKTALARYNIRPMGRKRAIEMLKRIYDDHHPVIDNLQTPKRRPRSPLVFNFDDEVNNSDDSNNSANECDTDDNPEDSVFFQNDEPVGASSNSNGSPTKGKLIKDVETGAKQFSEWLRLSENEELYQSVLSMQPINLNDITTLMAASTHGVRRITKKILAEVLDRLHITFSIPDQKWGRARGYKNG